MRLKPIEYDFHMKYMCPKCQYCHWVSLEEAKTEKFIIVCDCKDILKIQTIDLIKIKYKNKKQKSNKNKEIDKAVSTLINYGFSKTEAQGMINEIIDKTDTTNTLDIIKLALKNFGEKNVEHS